MDVEKGFQTNELLFFFLPKAAYASFPQYKVSVLAQHLLISVESSLSIFSGLISFQ